MSRRNSKALFFKPVGCHSGVTAVLLLFFQCRPSLHPSCDSRLSDLFLWENKKGVKGAIQACERFPRLRFMPSLILLSFSCTFFTLFFFFLLLSCLHLLSVSAFTASFVLQICEKSASSSLFIFPWSDSEKKQRFPVQFVQAFKFKSDRKTPGIPRGVVCHCLEEKSAGKWIEFVCVYGKSLMSSERSD